MNFQAILAFCMKKGHSNNCSALNYFKFSIQCFRHLWLIWDLVDLSWVSKKAMSLVQALEIITVSRKPNFSICDLDWMTLMVWLNFQVENTIWYLIWEEALFLHIVWRPPQSSEENKLLEKCQCVCKVFLLKNKYGFSLESLFSWIVSIRPSKGLVSCLWPCL